MCRVSSKTTAAAAATSGAQTSAEMSQEVWVLVAEIVLAMPVWPRPLPVGARKQKTVPSTAQLSMPVHCHCLEVQCAGKGL